MSSLLFGGQNVFSSLPRPYYFAPGRFEEYDEFILFLISSWSYSSFSSYHPGAKELAQQGIE